MSSVIWNRLGVATAKTLQAAGIHSIEKLLEHTEDELVVIKGLRGFRLDDINEVLNRHGLSLRKPLGPSPVAGITLRDYLAGQAMTGFIQDFCGASPRVTGKTLEDFSAAIDRHAYVLASASYMMADAMLHARSEADASTRYRPPQRVGAQSESPQR